MTDMAIWLLRWTIAGAALSTIVIATGYVLERSGRAAGLHLYRVSLLAAFLAPVVAFAPPLLTFSATPPAPAEAYRAVSPAVEQPGAEREVPAASAEDRNRGGLGEVTLDVSAIALIAVWAAGAALAGIRRQRSALRLSRAFRAGAPYPASFVECRLSADAQTALVFGLLHPRMLAPAAFSDWPPAEREAVLRHEEAHLRRGDLVWAAIADAVAIAYWWAPPVVILTRQHLLVTEEACDSASLGKSDNRHEYARTLLAITRRVGRHTALGLAATGPSLRRRIERLISPQRTFAFAAPIGTIAAAASIVLALCGPAAAQVDRFRIYIFVAAGGASDTYAISDGARATAATVRSCVGQRSPNASAFIDQLEARIRNGEQDELKPITIVGPGSEIDVGSCQPSAVRDVHDEDTLVVVVDASERQARRLIWQIHALSREDQRQMLAELGLPDRR